VALWEVTFKNRSTKRVGNLKYKTHYYAETGREVDTGGSGSLLQSGIIEKVIEPKSARTIEVNDGFLHQETSTARFELIGWEFIQ
jgi:hypothetical protein